MIHAHPFDASSTLWFDRPAERWLEALPVGNGRLGTMCFGALGGEHLQVNDETAWSGSPTRQLDDPPDPDAARESLQTARRALSAGDTAGAERAVQRLQHDYSQSYLPLVDCFVQITMDGRPLALAGAVSGYSRSLHLTTGVAEHRYAVDGFEVVYRTFASAGSNVLVSQVVSAHPSPIAVTVSLTTPLHVLRAAVEDAGDAGLATVEVRLPSDVAPKHDDMPVPTTWDDTPGRAIQGAAAALVEQDGHTAIVVIGTETTYRGPDEALEGDSASCLSTLLERLHRARSLGVDRLLHDHLADHAALFSRVQLHLPTGPTSALPTDRRVQEGTWRDDPSLLALLHGYGRYLLMAASLPGSQLPATLQGIWNDSMRPSWSSNYTLNINTEMNYWAAESTGLAECHVVLLDFLHALAARGATTAATLYGARGWVAHHNADAWAFTWPVGRGQADPRWAAWPSAGFWLARHPWETFLHSGDRSRLAHDWPVIRGALEFARDWVVEEADGTLGTSPSTSPENGYLTPDGSVATVDRSTTMDVELLRDLLGFAVQAAQELQLQDDELVEWAAGARARLRPLAVGASGRVLEWAQEYPEPEPHHRHLSHLVGFFPGDRVADPAWSAAVAATLDGRGDDSTGWSLAWKLALRARIADGDAIPALLDLLTRPVSAGGDSDDDANGEVDAPWSGGLYPNLFSAHPPFQIDGNLGFTAAFTEALMQSHGGEIVLLPALPPGLPQGSVSGLVARGGIRVSLSWRDGRLTQAGLCCTSPGSAQQSVRVRYGDEVREVCLAADVEWRWATASHSSR